MEICNCKSNKKDGIYMLYYKNWGLIKICNYINGEYKNNKIKKLKKIIF